MHKAYYLFTCNCVSIKSFHSHSHYFIHDRYIKENACDLYQRSIFLVNLGRAIVKLNPLRSYTCPSYCMHMCGCEL